jgi:hypothetical protein
MGRTKVPAPVRQRVREAAANRCGYCRAAQRHILGILEIEHIIPLACGGSDEELNLWLSCSLCNRYKGVQIEYFDPESLAIVPLFNPRTQKWIEHFCWNVAGTRIIGLTSTGRATVEALKLNNPLAVEVRSGWVAAGWHPPTL